MRLSAPKRLTWWIAVILGVVGLLMNFGVLSIAGFSSFWLVAIGFILLALATLFKGI